MSTQRIPLLTGKHSFRRNFRLADAVCDEAKPGYKAGNPIIDKNYEEIVNDMVDSIKKMHNLYLSNIRCRLPEIDKTIERIIITKSKNKKEIERNLDDLLEFVTFGKGEKQLLRILGYYKEVDPKGYRFYLGEYRKIKYEK